MRTENNNFDEWEGIFDNKECPKEETGNWLDSFDDLDGMEYLSGGIGFDVDAILEDCARAQREEEQRQKP